MTIHELKKEVEALSFSGLRVADDSLIYTANRALKMIHTYHPKTKRAELGFFPEEAILHRDLIVGEGTEVSLSVPAGILKMKLQGQGQYTVSYGNKSINYRFSQTLKHVEIIFHQDGELKFTADSIFCAWDISVYSRNGFPYESAVSRVGDNLILDIREIFPDLLYLADAPREIGGNAIKGLVVTDASHLMLPKNYRGVISLVYRAASNPISEDSKDSDQIDIAEELTPLLPLLVTYFLWLDDEPDIAKAYLAEYEKTSREIQRIKNKAPSEYVDVNKWS